LLRVDIVDGVKQKLWAGAGVVAIVLVLVLRALSRMAVLTSGPLHEWYVQAAIVAGALALYGLGAWLFARAYAD
jgi:hypothetical protein